MKTLTRTQVVNLVIVAGLILAFAGAYYAYIVNAK